MDRRRHTGDNGQVIGIGKGGDNGFSCGKNPLLTEMPQGREEAAVETILEIGGIATIDADNSRCFDKILPETCTDILRTARESAVTFPHTLLLCVSVRAML